MARWGTFWQTLLAAWEAAWEVAWAPMAPARAWAAVRGLLGQAAACRLAEGERMDAVVVKDTLRTERVAVHL